MNDDLEDERFPRVRAQSLCPCKSRLNYGTCCMPFHHGKAKPTTAEQLMRSRYSAYFFRLVDYLYETTHPDTREKNLLHDLNEMIHAVNWSFLTIVTTSKGGPEDKTGKVEFIADFYAEGEQRQFHEISRFKRYKGQWRYLDGKS